ncbi:D-2-hydroxyacid dehydrogenase [Rhizobium sp. FY34]|uniref:D-2-hydroxyacid dehydrogenase n=1 Tax=Rhizobium sp. FY34 TaxID=2562309 RepID=UPI0010C0BBED|nr:D-2-hydroxyacid dehydrogenase [Rhizobium sp. FY34]
MKTIIVHDDAADWYCSALADLPGCRFVPSTAVTSASAMDVEALIAFAPSTPASLLESLPALRWIHSLTAGVDRLMAMPALGRGVAVTTSSGIHGPQMSEMAFLLMLAAARQFPAMIANQAAAHWERWPQPLLLNKTACIVGLGAIAETLVERCRAFGMRVTGVSSGRSDMAGVDRIYPREALREAAAEADFLIVLVPYAASTHHLIDASVLASMKRSSILINLSRGGCVDEDALCKALRAGNLFAAGCDVFSQEPLPSDNPLWSLPNLIVTPHVGGWSDVYAEQTVPLLRRNLQRFLAGDIDGLENLVSRNHA